MPRFIQTIDSNGNKIINLPEIDAGNQNSLNVKAEDTISLGSETFKVESPTSILLNSEGTEEGKGTISVTAKQSLIASGGESTTVGLTTSTTNIIGNIEITGLEVNETITIDNMMLLVYSNGVNKYDNTNGAWLVLEKGNNTINISGNCVVEVLCEFPQLV